MKPRKLLMIVNPRAGKNKSHGPLFDAAAALSQAGYLLSIPATPPGPPNGRAGGTTWSWPWAATGR